MDIIFELILDILFEGSIEICSNKKISKWIWYPLLIILNVLLIVVIIGTFILGILLYKTSIVLSIIFIICSILFLIGGIVKFKKLYNERKQ